MVRVTLAAAALTAGAITRAVPRVMRTLRMRSRIQMALNSSDPDVVLEGQVAQHIGASNVERFQDEIHVDGRRVGEIDVQTSTMVVEVTNGSGAGKGRQLRRLISERQSSLGGRELVLFAPNITSGRRRHWSGLGIRVVRSLDEL